MINVKYDSKLLYGHSTDLAELYARAKTCTELYYYVGTQWLYADITVHTLQCAIFNITMEKMQVISDDNTQFGIPSPCLFALFTAAQIQAFNVCLNLRGMYFFCKGSSHNVKCLFNSCTVQYIPFLICLR